MQKARREIKTKKRIQLLRAILTTHHGPLMHSAGCGEGETVTMLDPIKGYVVE